MDLFQVDTGYIYKISQIFWMKYVLKLISKTTVKLHKKSIDFLLGFQKFTFCLWSSEFRWEGGGWKGGYPAIHLLDAPMICSNWASYADNERNSKQKFPLVQHIQELNKTQSFNHNLFGFSWQ